MPFIYYIKQCDIKYKMKVMEKEYPFMGFSVENQETTLLKAARGRVSLSTTDQCDLPIDWIIYPLLIFYVQNSRMYEVLTPNLTHCHRIFVPLKIDVKANSDHTGTKKMALIQVAANFATMMEVVEWVQ